MLLEAQTRTPSSFGHLTKLNYLDLSCKIPSTFGTLQVSLRSRFLSTISVLLQTLRGPIPDSIYRFQNLEKLDLALNFFGVILELKRLLKSRNLVSLQLSGNNLLLLDSHNAAIPPSKFSFLRFSA
ncbi:hypothetical protein SADUNF_Sadunf16G0110700 [Salix dunnii]|uniref:Uncharacterized protein n=1 Tax=Salix dunnii TaxID=1413687 RepID=A0A835J939_9ROSI|nr:hypothetical protein SADUNF_Sadunf16G0110700 [Salix dunnii]